MNAAMPGAAEEASSTRYRVRHETIYSYGGDVAHSHQLLHLTPRAAPDQICHTHALELEPAPSSRHDDVDAFGNLVTRLEYDRPHDRLEVSAEMDIEVLAPPPLTPAASLPWEAVNESLRYQGRTPPPDELDACRFRMESSYVKVKSQFTEYGADCFTPGAPILAAAEALMHKVHRDFTYAPGTTTIRTAAVEAFAARRGVCQDFAHIMIACCRARGLAARYVSGYLRTIPPGNPDPALVGSDASHAWVAVFCPPFGWVALDPTNDVRGNRDHITVAWGRDFGDVSPLRGVLVGGGRHRLTVRVCVQAE
jgi:transglutaminase-like putative cysteine protease